MKGWAKYKRKPELAEMKPWTPDVDMSRVSISEEDKEAGKPELGDMVARDPDNISDQWLVSKSYFEDKFDTEPVVVL